MNQKNSILLDICCGSVKIVHNFLGVDKGDNEKRCAPPVYRGGGVVIYISPSHGTTSVV